MMIFWMGRKGQAATIAVHCGWMTSDTGGGWHPFGVWHPWGVIFMGSGVTHQWGKQGVWYIRGVDISLGVTSWLVIRRWQAGVEAGERRIKPEPRSAPILLCAFFSKAAELWNHAVSKVLSGRMFCTPLSTEAINCCDSSAKRKEIHNGCHIKVQMCQKQKLNCSR